MNKVLGTPRYLRMQQVVRWCDKVRFVGESCGILSSPWSAGTWVVANPNTEGLKARILFGGNAGN